LRQNAQAMQQGTRAASVAVTRVGNVTVDVTQRSGQVGAEAMTRVGDAASEALRQSVEVLAGTQREFVRKAAQQFEHASQRLAQATQTTSADLRAFLTSQSGNNDGLWDLQRSMAGFIEGVMRTNLQASQEMLRLADPGALVALQQRFVRAYLSTWTQGTATVLRATRNSADETLRRIEQRQHDASEQHHAAAE